MFFLLIFGKVEIGLWIDGPLIEPKACTVI